MLEVETTISKQSFAVESIQVSVAHSGNMVELPQPELISRSGKAVLFPAKGDDKGFWVPMNLLRGYDMGLTWGVKLCVPKWFIQKKFLWNKLK